ncbi:ATP-binding protein [Pedobacter aquatilis]|uniref:ATP-binding protein n=1 Tax=Pedobacter aquatilis TaxID=351343 RepID=UPI00292FC4B1|nr:ATP-binding protein [Pedobacter aquatilis]
MTTPDTFNNSRFDDSLIIQALASSPAPTAIYTGEEMTIQFANAGMLALWGKDASVIGKTLMDAIPELEGQPFLAILQEVWASGKTYSVSDAPAVLIKNGMSVTDYFDYEYRPLLSRENQTWCILNTALEVTSRRDFLIRIQQKEETEQALNEEMGATLEELTSTNEDLNDSLRLLAQSREHVRTIIEQAPVGIAMLEGPDHIIDIANPAILKIWGRSESEVVGLPHKAARPELAGQPINNWLQEVYTTGKQKVNNEFLVRLFNKGAFREAVVNSIYQPIHSPAGEITGVLVILEEITDQVVERKRNEKDQHMLALAIEAGELATFCYEPATNLFSGNTLLKTWFGLSFDEQIDISLALNIIIPEDRGRVATAISDAITPGSVGHYAAEYSILNPKEENPRRVQATGKVIYHSDGTVMSLNGTLRDITAQKKEEQRKDDFMSMVSHELKTPLTSLKAYLQLLQRMAIMKENTSEQDTLSKSLRQVHNMTTMINGFLNVSRLDSGRMHVEKSEFDLASLFKELAEELNATVHTHTIVIQQIPDTYCLFADREKIGQVIQNLIGNAIKYSAMGTTITAGCSMTDNGNIKIFVSDQGMGIAEEDQLKIFERYYRVKGNATGSIAGFGIGLYLCKEIIELHGGSIQVQSSSNSGSTFSFTLPAK